MHPFASFRYCPKCGSQNFPENDVKSRKCLSCGFVYYFNPAAAVVAFITNDKEEVLVCRRAGEPAAGTWDLPGGFADCDETAEEAVAREVKEETGLEVTEVRYLFSLPNIYPYSGFDVHTLDLFFECRVRPGGIPEARDDAAELFFVPFSVLSPGRFGLASIRTGVGRIGEERRRQERSRQSDKPEKA